MPERREFPVEHRDDPRFGRVKNEIVAAKVAMHDRHSLGISRSGMVKPCNHPVHVRIPAGDRIGQILLGKPFYLAFDIASRPAEAAEANLVGVQRVQVRDCRVHGPEIVGSIAGADVGKGCIPKNSAFDQFHQVKHRSDDFGVDAACVNPGHGNARVGERGLHHRFAIDGMGAL